MRKKKFNRLIKIYQKFKVLLSLITYQRFGVFFLFEAPRRGGHAILIFAMPTLRQNIAARFAKYHNSEEDICI